MHKPDIIRKKILKQVADYFISQQKNKFIPGQTSIPYAGRIYDAKELVSLVDASLDFWLTAGRYTAKFEKKLAGFLGIKYCLLANSGSSANLLAVAALTSPLLKNRQLYPGDEVIATACGFPTTLNPVLQNNLVPVFIDVDLGTYNIQVEKIEKAISKKTKAIFTAHTLGNPIDIDRIKKIVQKYNLWWLEDNCDALGSKYNAKFTGTFGDISTCSFFPAHHITMGEGGAVLTNNPLFRKIIMSFRDWGRSCFIMGTPVVLKGKVKNIENIIIGDKVLTHKGTFLPVTDTFKKLYTGKIYNFKAHLIQPFQATKDHRFLVLRNNKAEWIKAENILRGRDLFLEAVPKCTRKPKTFSWEYKTAYKKVKCSIKPDKDLMRLIGYWLAEGNIAKGFKGQSGYKFNQKYYFHKIEFSFNKDETEYINDVKRLVLKYFKVKMQARRQGNGVLLSFKTRSGYEFFKEFFKTGALNKTLWEGMEYWGLDLVNSLLKGFWRGDGSRDFQKFSICSISPDLIEKIRVILIRNNILPCYGIRTVDKHKASIVKGKIITAKHNLYKLECYGINGERFANIVDEKYISRTKRQQAFFKIINNIKYIAYPVHRISYKTYKSRIVYNLEVEGPHSYHAGRVAAHNCWCEPGNDNTCNNRFSQKFGGLPYGYDHKYVYSHIGYNLKVTDMQAAIGCAQLEKLQGFIKARKKNFKFLYQIFEKYNNYFILPQAEINSDPSWFGFPILVKENALFTRNDIVRYLEKNKIATRMLFGGNLIKQPAYKNSKYRIYGKLKNTDLVMNNLFWIGVYPGINYFMLTYIKNTFESFFNTRKL